MRSGIVVSWNDPCGNSVVPKEVGIIVSKSVIAGMPPKESLGTARSKAHSGMPCAIMGFGRISCNGPGPCCDRSGGVAGQVSGGERWDSRAASDRPGSGSSSSHRSKSSTIASHVGSVNDRSAPTMASSEGENTSCLDRR